MGSHMIRRKPECDFNDCPNFWFENWPVKTDRYLTKSRVVPKWGYHRFIVYEKSVEGFMLGSGLAHIEIYPSTEIYKIKDRLLQIEGRYIETYFWLMHPWVAYQLYKELMRREKGREILLNGYRR